MYYVFGFLILISYFENVLSNEYYIEKDKVPAYIYKYIKDVKESRFPLSIRINLLLSHISGLLLYSLDKNKNQFIVYFSNPSTTEFFVEYRGKRDYLFLKKLCNCPRDCKYKNLTMTFKVESKLLVECNGYKEVSLDYPKNSTSNLNYPTMLEFKSNRGNSARLYVGNHPQVGKVFPHNRQMEGCISSIELVDGVLKNFENKNMQVTCAKKCTKDICNKGLCLETYKFPLCDCSYVSGNGKFCNETLLKGEEEARFLFNGTVDSKIYKLSWTANVMTVTLELRKNDEIQFKMSNNWMNINYTLNSENLVYKGKMKGMKKGTNFLIINFNNNSFSINSKTEKIVPFKFKDFKVKSITAQTSGNFSIANQENIKWRQLKDYEKITKTPDRKSVTRTTIITDETEVLHGPKERSKIIANVDKIEEKKRIKSESKECSNFPTVLFCVFIFLLFGLIITIITIYELRIRHKYYTKYGSRL